MISHKIQNILLPVSITKNELTGTEFYEDGYILDCCTVKSGRHLLTFQRCLLPASSGRLVSVEKLLPDYTAQQPRRDSHLHTRRRENLNSYNGILCFALYRSCTPTSTVEQDGGCFRTKC
jgi:hypothetical protein